MDHNAGSKYRSLYALIVAAFCLSTQPSAAADVTIDPLQSHTNEFGGREITRSFRVESNKPLAGRFVWSLSAKEHTLARGEREVRVAEETDDVDIKFRLNPLRDEVVLPVTLKVAVIVKQEEVARHQLRLWLFPEDPFGKRGEWLRSLDIVLFDPGEQTAKVFQDAAIPFRETRNLTRIRAMDNGTLIVGSRVSQRDHRGLAETTLAAAARGTRVLWLSPADGSYPARLLESASELAFSDAKIIRRLDKRLDSTGWSGGELIASRVKLHASGKQIGVQVSDEGWPWMEARWSATNGRFVVSGFAVVERWEDSPTPRSMLLRILERLNAEESSQ